MELDMKELNRRVAAATRVYAALKSRMEDYANMPTPENAKTILELAQVLHNTWERELPN